MQNTISLLPVSLSLVHVPRSRISQVSHPILRQILHPNPGFLNITCNDIELSVFAEDHMLEDFEPIARKDRRRQRQRANSTSSRSSAIDFEPVEISYEKWSVLQIDSHSSQIDLLDNSGARVHELSAPLAAAGISILYQSSYTSDFIFVKEARLQEVLSLFSEAGFDLYSTSTPITTGRTPFSELQASPFETPSYFSAVLTRSTSVVDATTAEQAASLPGSPSRTKSQSPSSSEVRILEPDLACVGLSDDFGVDHWGLKIVKLVAFPDMISRPSSSGNPPRASEATSPINLSPTRSPVASPHELRSLASPKRARPFTPPSSESDDDGYYSHSPPKPTPLSLPSPSRSQTDLSISMAPLQTASIHASSPYAAQPTPSKRGSTNSSSKTSPVSFFSFTRTPEGSSLTADVKVLATLFPANERHMVICGGELDAADEELDGARDQPSDETENGPYGSSTQKCLQVDLRRFGLDKHGLVNRFSQVLEQEGINHMYSSTFKTANILVDKKHAMRAQSLLRSC
ncbi:hypothetical protein BKA70DRAFT_1368898 [Coprinopsis sp. MPI-PUGE-AT-0042]|nr:hypothetical protein BKA70DRAFT_1368898 [Coprinopsis sp. MPI-PUGE-AT-0042]